MRCDVSTPIHPTRGADPARATLAVLLAAFLSAQVPLAHVLQFHHRDERHYTDASILMVETGDYWTPRRYDGHPRPHKPLGTYWAVAGSFRLFGITPLASRIPSLAAGILTLALTFLLAKTVTGSPERGLLAACILATQPTFLLCSNRTTPDIFLTASLTVGFLGLAKLLASPSPSRRAWLLTLVGAGLAVFSKGLLGVVFLVFALVAFQQTHKAVFRRHRLRLAVALGIWAALSAAWFVAMGLRHGAGFLSGFLYDQVIGRFLFDPWWHKPFNIAGYAILNILLLLPWWIALAWQRSKGVATVPRSGSVPVHVSRCFLSWAGLCAMIFGLGNKLTGRYILSAVPLWATVVAGLFPMRPPGGQAEATTTGWGFRFQLLLGGLGLAAFAILPLTGGLRNLAVPAVSFTLCAGLAWGLSRQVAASGVATPVRWSAAVLVFLAWTALFLRQPFASAAECGLARDIAVLRRNRQTQGTLLCDFHPSLLARTRLHAGRQIEALPLSDLGTNALPATIHARVISNFSTSDRHAGSFTPTGELSLPAPSLREARKACAAQGIPYPLALLRSLRDGLPRMAYRVETRVPTPPPTLPDTSSRPQELP